MLTTCTACGTQFRVNAAQLSAVHGLVRCSRCQSVFDAFETLREEFVVPADPAPPPPDELHALAEELGHDDAPPSARVPANFAAHPGRATEPVIRADAGETPKTAEELFAEVWGEPPDEPPLEPDSAPEAEPEPRSEPEPILIEDHIPQAPELTLDQKLYRHKELPPREAQTDVAQRRRFRFSLWGWGAFLLALVLLMQVINANRLSLSRAVIIGPAISGLYAALGSPLAPPPAPNSWQISNTNVTSDPEMPGALSISGTLENRASFAQSWPVLRVDLTDRDGNPLQDRDFTAGNYLPASRVATWLGPGMAVQFRIDVVDPGADAVGFTVLPCIDTQGKRDCGNAND